MLKTKNEGFTLIELLIVIVLIGILSGILLAVIQPGAQRARANEAVMNENLNKLVMAVQACINARANITPCAANSAANGSLAATFTNLGANNPAGQPTSGTVYRVYSGTGVIVVEAALGGTYSQIYPTAGNSTTLCEIRNVINTTTGVNTRTLGSKCSID